jgi:RimJ/RimL family protein N-acetyltransferase
LQLIEEVAFKELKLKKIYTYAFDLRKALYPIFEYNGFAKEGQLKAHKKIGEKFVDVVIHAKLSQIK